MKKLMIAFFSGAIMLGIGAGIFLIELSDWGISYERSDLADMPQQVYSKQTNINMSDAKSLDINISGNYGYLEDYVKTEIIKNPEYTDSVMVEITYCGSKPYADYYTYFIDEDEDGVNEVYYTYRIRTDNYQSFAEMKETVQKMFRKKTFFRDFSNSLIKEIKITTAYPDKIHIY